MCVRASLMGCIQKGSCLLQSGLREHFGIPPPGIEHRAHEDVRVLLAVTQKLLQLGVHACFAWNV